MIYNDIGGFRNIKDGMASWKETAMGVQSIEPNKIEIQKPNKRQRHI